MSPLRTEQHHLLRLTLLFIVSCFLGFCDSTPTDTAGFNPIWRYPALGLFLGAPSVDDERVFLMIRDSLIALDQQTGSRVWARSPSGQPNSTMSIPIVDGVIYVASGEFIVAYEAATGAERWRTRLLPQFGLADPGSGVEVGEEQVYAGTFGGVYALDRQSGAILWHTRLNPLPKQIRAAGQLACVGQNASGLEQPQGAITCLSIQDGGVVWRFELPQIVEGQRTCADGGVPGKPTAAEGLLLFGDECGQLFALDLDTGSVVWRRFFETAFDSEILTNGQNGYTCARSDRFCYSFTLADGTVIWRTQGTSGFVEPPTLDRGSLYAVDLGGVLYRLDASSGAVIWKVSSHDANGSLLSRPAVRDGIVFSGGGDWFYALHSQ